MVPNGRTPTSLGTRTVGREGLRLVPMDLIVSLLITAASFAAIGLMAYYATRVEKAGPRCPRCLNRVRSGALACRSCHLELEWSSEDATPDHRAP